MIRRAASLMAVALATSGGGVGVTWGEEASRPAVAFNGTVSSTVLAESGAYFGSPDQPSESSDYLWGELFAGVTWELAIADGVTGELGVAGLATVGQDYWGVADGTQAIVHRALVTASDIAGSGVSFTIGRQDLEIGDGFIIGDGYSEAEAALWSIPLRFFDALRIDLDRERLHVTALAARLGHSFPPPCAQCGGQEGALWGLDVLLGGEGASVGFGHFRRHDTSLLGHDGHVSALRGDASVGRFSVAGEYAWEGGWVREPGGGQEAQRRELAGRAGHLDVTWWAAEDRSVWLTATAMLFSGDDPATPELERYSQWNHGASDWNRYWVGNIVGNQMLFDQDERVLMLEGGWEVSAVLTVRAFLLGYWLDTGADVCGPGECPDLRFADEAMLTAEWQALPNLSTWALAGYARPRAAGRMLFGDEDAMELLAGFTFSF